MATLSPKRERVRQLSLIAYVVMLALLLPLTMFLIKQEQHLNSNAQTTASTSAGANVSSIPSVSVSAGASPGFGVIAPCPSCNIEASPAVSPAVSSAVSVVPSVIEAPASVAPSTNPCAAGDNSVASDTKHHKHKGHHGAVNNISEGILQFLIKLLELLLQLLGGGGGSVSNPAEVPSTAPNPCNPAGVPSTVPMETVAPVTSIAPVISTAPMVSSAPSVMAQPSTAVFTPVSTAPVSTAPAGGSTNPPLACIPSGQKCDATGAKQCCSGNCVHNINPNLPNDPGDCE